MKTAIDLAIAEIGTVEWADGSNPKVIAYYRDAGHFEVKDDSVAWCAAFVGAMLHRAGGKGSGSLAARSYLKWGNEVPIKNAQRGDIGVIPRGNSTWQGHVFFIERIDGGKVHVVGGNQRDSVSRAVYPVASLLGVRRAIMAKPMAPAIPAQPEHIPDPVAKPSLWAALFETIATIFRKGA